MRILVISDSHGNEAAVRAVLEQEPLAKTVIHLGDGAREAEKLQAEYRDRDWHIVCGNCDIGVNVPEKKIVSIGGNTLYLTHGHAERVKSGLLTLCYTARGCNAAVALYGHTHVPSIEFDAGVMLMNPGSLGQSGAYGILDVNGRDLRPSLQRMP